MLRRLSQIFCGFFLGYLGLPARRYRSYYCSLATPVVVGICLGITIQMLFMEVGCYSEGLRQTADQMMQSKSAKSILKRSLNDTVPDDDNSDFEARIIAVPTRNNTVNTNVTRPRFYRPHFALDELKVKEKLFVAVLTSANSLEKFGTAVDKTMAKHFPEVIFFSSGKPKSEPAGLKLVAFDDKKPEMLPILVLTYIKENLADEYDFYLFVTDKTYLRAQKYHELVRHISVKEDVYMGALGLDRNFCALEGGVLLSFSIMSQVLSELPYCTLKVQPGNPGASFGSCVHLASQKFCMPWAGDLKLKFYRLDNFDYDTDIEQLKTDPYFNQSLTFYPMPDDTSFYKLHRYFCTIALTEVQKKIALAKADIIDLSKFAPGGHNSITWPIGTQQPYKEISRFSVIQWTYFTETQMFLDNELTNVEDISGVHIPDVNDIKKETMENLNKKYPSRYKLEKIINGYRRFDPTRGMEYILDLLLLDKKNNNVETFKRVHLVRPLGKVELIQTPFVTESTPLHIILPLRPEHVDYFEMFLYTYARSCIETKEDVFLIVALLYPSSLSADQKDPFAKSKTTIDNISKKYNTPKAKLYWKALENVVTDINIIDNLQSEFKTDVLILMITVNMEMSPDFTKQYLNRVRINTVQRAQVFFPVGFWQYRPNLIYDKKPFPASVEIGQRLGLYDTKTADTAGFYLSDYKTARKIVGRPTDIFSMFVTSKKFHVLQAVEPNLKLKWMNITCDQRLTEEKYQQCVTHNLEGLASQPHLAKLIYEHQRGSISKPDNAKIDPKMANKPHQAVNQKSAHKSSKQKPAVNQKTVTDRPIAPFMKKPRRVPSPKYKMQSPKLKLHKVNFDKSMDDPLGEGMLLVNPKLPIKF
ncbi:chondroitin sulfate synthase 2-like [Mercenaria mercenaria]|uniref:chondroitin sulfate synthase 2-like n=1 Tax=Mercenaria mercenaria TaxID=6596 RepID=UPI00234F3BD2|nr:chondroitin sulfate synthase 2-like [Mercenaria mercenaria]